MSYINSMLEKCVYKLQPLDQESYLFLTRGRDLGIERAGKIKTKNLQGPKRIVYIHSIQEWQDLSNITNTSLYTP